MLIICLSLDFTWMYFVCLILMKTEYKQLLLITANELLTDMLMRNMLVVVIVVITIGRCSSNSIGSSWCISCSGSK